MKLRSLALLLVLATTRLSVGDEASPTLRQPVAMVLLDGGKRIAVANERSGTVSIVDVERKRVEAEVAVGDRLSDLAVSNRWLTAVDAGQHKAIHLKPKADSFVLDSHTPVAKHARTIAESRNLGRFAVVSSWSRVVGFYAGPSAGLTVNRGQVKLPFVPGQQLFVGDGQTLLVAEAYGGRIAVIDALHATLLSVRALPAHNIRGLAYDPARRVLIVAHQTLDAKASSTSDDILAGRLLQHVVRTIPLANVLDPEKSLTDDNRVIVLGDADQGAADPAGVAVLPDGKIAVALAGVHQVAIIDEENRIERYDVGRRPTRVAVTENGDLFVLNTFDDSVSILPASNRAAIERISLGPTRALTPAERGERAFYDARLSTNGWMSCHSCHSDGHTSQALADTLADGTYGTPKRIPSLLGTRDTDRWGWTAAFKELHDQTRQSIDVTMHGRATTDDVNDLVAYLHTLDPPPPVEPARDSDQDRATLARGRAVFEAQRCTQCHIPPLTYTSPEPVDVGLRDEAGTEKFNPPSLRGVSQLDAFFHDRRVESLEDVIGTFGHQLQGELSEQESKDLLRFLRSL